jgi:hypothetical protein
MTPTTVLVLSLRENLRLISKSDVDHHSKRPSGTLPGTHANDPGTIPVEIYWDLNASVG